jgi:hypothetical protein
MAVFVAEIVLGDVAAVVGVPDVHFVGVEFVAL